jgi:hypothetical protein
MLSILCVPYAEIHPIRRVLRDRRAANAVHSSTNSSDTVPPEEASMAHARCRQAIRRALVTVTISRWLLGVAAAVVAMAGAAPSQLAFAHDFAEKSFVASWSVGHINPLPANIAEYSNQTLRAIVRPSIGGDHVRVRIANTFGTETIMIGAASIAVSNAGSKIIPGTQRRLTFSGQRSISIPAGAPVLSDPVRLHVKPQTELAISIYLPNPTKTETSTLFQGTSYVSLSSGNHVAAID